MRYVAYVVDLAGVARAAYEIDCPTHDDAQTRAKKFLKGYPTVELWEDPPMLRGWCVQTGQIRSTGMRKLRSRRKRPELDLRSVMEERSMANVIVALRSSLRCEIASFLGQWSAEAGGNGTSS
jgi:hypothetical protein